MPTPRPPPATDPAKKLAPQRWPNRHHAPYLLPGVWTQTLRSDSGHRPSANWLSPASGEIPSWSRPRLPPWFHRGDPFPSLCGPPPSACPSPSVSRRCWPSVAGAPTGRTLAIHGGRRSCCAGTTRSRFLGGLRGRTGPIERANRCDSRRKRPFSFGLTGSPGYDGSLRLNKRETPANSDRRARPYRGR